jgi:hypothetical protein
VAFPFRGGGSKPKSPWRGLDRSDGLSPTGSFAGSAVALARQRASHKVGGDKPRGVAEILKRFFK